MSQEVFCVLKELNFHNIATQLALQCAPVIAGVKVANLLCIKSDCDKELRDIMSDSGLMIYKLCTGNKGTTYLIYRKLELEKYILNVQSEEFLKNEGYKELSLESILKRFSIRYAQYMLNHEDFPHEMGILLGYPVEDVIGFIDNKGKDYLYSGYWKVYQNVNEKKQIFEKYDRATEIIINMVSSGMDMSLIYKKAPVCIVA